MSEFIPKSVRLVGAIKLAGPIKEVFPLFSPLGEKRWVPYWNPELLYPPGAVWEEGLIFRTKEEKGDAIWILTKLDQTRYEVEYQRVEPKRYVARITVHCTALAERITEAATSYEFIGLSQDGNSEIVTMNQEDYAQKMRRWAQWINEYLKTQTE